jgi:ubiquinone/menaquinone biosynthesis C-methylase UbiE
MDKQLTLEAVRDYYGKVLKTKADLQTTACCAVESLPGPLAALERQLHKEVRDRFYGCGSPLPPALEGATVLDLGCGSGRDAYLLSKLVGPTGSVIGVDMTDEQLEVARRHVDFHRELWGHRESNVRFLKGYIEDLESAGIETGTVDLVTSNCVFNLSPDKPRLFREVLRVLKPGGELYFSDVFADRRLPKELAQDPEVVGECLGGAMYTEDFRRLLLELGVRDFRAIASTPIAMTNERIQRKVGRANFRSITFRVFKLDLEDKCEDFGQVATYRGTIADAPDAFLLDDHHLFETGRPMLVCGNTAAMVQETRYGRHFEVRGDKSRHFGLFDCTPPVVANPLGPAASGACC